MFDPLGAFDRIIDQFVAYMETAYRIDDQQFSRKRNELLKSAGSLALAPIFELVARYRTCDTGLEDVIFRDDFLSGFPASARETFAELVLSGLFDGRPSDNKVGRTGIYKPYLHQIEMLQRGVVDGQPGVVTSGTGSGKTEAFLLPILAQIVREAEKWPEHSGGYEENWLAPRQRFRLHRQDEHPDRPKAMRAMILYPLNALVEDQMVRLRKSLDSPEARNVMDRRMGGNRIFFGRYTGKTPVTGFRLHPRLNDVDSWKKRRDKRRNELKAELRKFAAIQERIATDGSAEDDLRYLFPRGCCRIKRSIT